MSQKPGKLKLFFIDLKRRKVTRLATIYVVVGLGIIEAADIIGGRFLVSEEAIRILIILIIGGFPVAIVLSWILDLTHKGIERTKALSPEEQASLPTLTWRPSWISFLLFMMLISLSVAFFAIPRTNALGFQARDWIVIADLENNTDDEVFDRSLMHALSVTIDQSKYVNIFPRRRVREVLQRMRIDSVDKIDTPLALEIAERENIKSVLVLTISELDNTYLLSTSLLDPYSGEIVRSRQVKAEGKGEVLQALNELATSVRRDLGETMGQILQRRMPLAKATTPSLEALKKYTDGSYTWSRGQYEEAQALWSRAVELDSGFAWANASLGLAAGWFGPKEEAQRYFDRALSQLDRVTEKERLWIIALSTDGPEGIHANQTYLQQYPDDRDGWYNLGNALREEMRIEEALEAYEQSLALDPLQVWPHVNMAVGYDGLGKYKEAAVHFEEVFQLDPGQLMSWGGDVNRISGFVLLKLGEHSRARERFELLLEGDEGNRANGLRSLALLEMYFGNHSAAVELFKQAIVINQRSEAPLSEFRNRMYLARAYQTMGMEASLAEELQIGQELMENGGWGPEWTIFLALRLVDIGDLPGARDMLAKWINSDWNQGDQEWAIELLRGELALAKGDPSNAIVSLELSDQLYHGQANIIEALGRAFHANGQYEQSEAFFLETIRLFQIGYECQEPWVLAHYRLGVVYEEMGETEKSRTYFKKFLELWGAGDEGLVGVEDARQRLQ